MGLEPAARPPAPVRVTPAMGAGIAIVATVVTVVMLEVLLTVAGFETGALSIQVADENDARAYHVFEDRHFEYDPELIWRPKRGQSIFNRQGFRGTELAAAKPAGQVRVFTVGDSNTLGWAGVDGTHWPGFLQDELRRVRPDTVVINAGIWGYASYQGLVRFRQTLAFEPDMVLVSFGSNDAHRVLQSDRAYATSPTRASAFGQLVRRTRLGQLILSAFEGPATAGPATLRPRVDLEEYQDNLTHMIREGRARGITVVLLTRPYVGGIDNPRWWKNWGADYARATIAVAEREGVPAIDVYSMFKGRDDLFADESHFTDDGHRLAAVLIAEHLRPLVGDAR